MRPIPAFLLLCISFQLAASSKGARIYYTDQPSGQAGTVRAVGLDGSNPAIVATFPVPADLRGIAWHRGSGRIFVLDNATGVKVIRSLLPNGTGVQTVTSVGNSASVSSDLEVDESTNMLFWAETSQQPDVNGLVRSCNLDGSNVATAVVGGPGIEFSPYFIYVDRPGGFIYWGVQQAVLQQNNPTTYRRASFAGVIDPNFSITTISRTRDIAIDSPTATAYWADRQQGTINRRALAGGANQVVFGGTSVLNAPHGLALDVVARKIYWADTGQRGSATQASARKVSRCNYDGTEYENLTTLDGLNEPWDLALDLSSPTYAQWATRFFPAAAPLRLPLQDADGDGMVNLLEYAFDGHPRSLGVPDTAAPPAPRAKGTGMVYPRRRTSPLTYRVEVSTDLLTWHYNGDGSGLTWTAEAAVAAVDSEMDEVTVAPGHALAGAVKSFFRVRVSSEE